MLQSLLPGSHCRLLLSMAVLCVSLTWTLVIDLGPFWVIQNKLLLSRSLTQSHLLPYEVTFTGPGIWRGILLGGGGEVHFWLTIVPLYLFTMLQFQEGHNSLKPRLWIPWAPGLNSAQWEKSCIYRESQSCSFCIPSFMSYPYIHQPINTNLEMMFSSCDLSFFNLLFAIWVSFSDFLKKS